MTLITHFRLWQWKRKHKMKIAYKEEHRETRRDRRTYMKNQNTFIIIIIAGLACFVLSPAGATCQEGCNTANANTYLGVNALINNTTGFFNTAIGYLALYINTNGFGNTASGYLALELNTTGSYNAAIGYQALLSNSTGYYNTAGGYETLLSNTTGYSNTASGVSALYSNTAGIFNTATGVDALAFNTTGAQNTASGGYALENNTTGNSNIAVGFDAGLNLTTGSNNIDIGNKGVAAESKKIRIGTRGTHTAAFIAGINGVTVAGGINVLVNTNGQLGTTTSSARYKEAIQPMDKASEAILSLKPVIFRYKHELDPAGIPQFGLVAEQVEKVNPGLVVRDDDGKPYSVRYDAVNAMLLNEFLKEHRKVQKQEAAITQLTKDFRATVMQLTTRLDEQASQLQRVSDQLAAASPSHGGLNVSKFTRRIRRGGTAPQIVLNNQ